MKVVDAQGRSINDLMESISVPDTLPADELNHIENFELPDLTQFTEVANMPESSFTSDFLGGMSQEAYRIPQSLVQMPIYMGKLASDVVHTLSFGKTDILSPRFRADSITQTRQTIGDRIVSAAWAMNYHIRDQIQNNSKILSERYGFDPKSFAAKLGAGSADLLALVAVHRLVSAGAVPGMGAVAAEGLAKTAVAGAMGLDVAAQTEIDAIQRGWPDWQARIYGMSKGITTSVLANLGLTFAIKGLSPTLMSVARSALTGVVVQGAGMTAANIGIDWVAGERKIETKDDLIEIGSEIASSMAVMGILGLGAGAVASANLALRLRDVVRELNPEMPEPKVKDVAREITEATLRRGTTLFSAMANDVPLSPIEVYPAKPIRKVNLLRPAGEFDVGTPTQKEWGRLMKNFGLEPLTGFETNERVRITTDTVVERASAAASEVFDPQHKSILRQAISGQVESFKKQTQGIEEKLNVLSDRWEKTFRELADVEGGGTKSGIVAEAKKYATPEEFVKSKEVFHGTDVEGIEFNDLISSSASGNKTPSREMSPTSGIWVTPDQHVTSEYGYRKLKGYVDTSNMLDVTNKKTAGKVAKFIKDEIDKGNIVGIETQGMSAAAIKEKLLTGTLFSIDSSERNADTPWQIQEKIIEFAKDNGFSVVKLLDNNRGVEHVSLGILDKSVLKTESELIDIWNKAQRTPTTSKAEALLGIESQIRELQAQKAEIESNANVFSFLISAGKVGIEGIESAEIKTGRITQKTEANAGEVSVDLSNSRVTFKAKDLVLKNLAWSKQMLDTSVDVFNEMQRQGHADLKSYIRSRSQIERATEDVLRNIGLSPAERDAIKRKLPSIDTPEAFGENVGKVKDIINREVDKKIIGVYRAAYQGEIQEVKSDLTQRKWPFDLETGKMFDSVFKTIKELDASGIKEVYDTLSSKTELSSKERILLDVAAFEYSKIDPAYMSKEHLQAAYQEFITHRIVGEAKRTALRKAQAQEVQSLLDDVSKYIQPIASSKLTGLMTYDTFLETLTARMPADVRLRVREKLSSFDAERIAEGLKGQYHLDLDAFEMQTRGLKTVSQLWDARLIDSRPAKNAKGELLTVPFEYKVTNPDGSLSTLKENTPLSRAQARTLYRMWQNAKVRSQLEKTMGLTDKTIETMKEEFFGRNDYALLDYWQTVTDGIYPQINNITEQLFNKPLGEVPYYISLSRDFDLGVRLGKSLKGLKISDADFDAWQILFPDRRLPATELNSSHIKERTLSEIPFKIEPDYFVMEKYYRRMANYVGFAKPVYYLQSLLNEIGGKLRSVFGDKFVAHGEHWADEFAGKAYDNTVGYFQDMATRAMHRAGLALVSTGKQFFTQGTSPLITFAECSPLDVLSSVKELTAIAPKDNVLLQTILKLPQTKARKNIALPEWKAYFEAIDSGDLKVNKTELMLMKALRMPLGTGDQMAFTFTAYVKAKELMRKLPADMPYEQKLMAAVPQAMEFANNTNQTADRSGAAMWTQDSNFFVRSAALFQSYGQQIINYTLKAGIEYRAGRITGQQFARRVLVANTLTAAAYQIAQDAGFSPDIKKWFLGVFLGTSLNSVPLLKDVISVVGYGFDNSSPLISVLEKGWHAVKGQVGLGVGFASGDITLDDLIEVFKYEGEALRQAAPAAAAVSLQAGLTAQVVGTIMRVVGEAADTENEYSFGMKARRVLMTLLGYSDKAVNRFVVGMEE